MKKLLLPFFVSLMLVGSVFADADISLEGESKIVLLHTNDLHGFIEHSVTDPNVGGYARLKSEITRQKLWAAENGYETLLFDAGDFLEGSLFYMVNKGRDLFSLMGTLGYDSVAMGNHDWLMGAREMSKMLKEEPPKFPYLAANVNVNKALYEGFKEIKPYHILYRGGLKIAVVGLTTDEVLYAWALKNGKIKDPVKTARKLLKKIRKKEKPDLVIALTHLGLEEDIQLAKKVKGFDLIVGGHSHTTLRDPIYPLPHKTPIVQAGSHGQFLGRIVIHVDREKKLHIKSYDLIPIVGEHVDGHTHEKVQEMRAGLNSLYGQDYLNEYIGMSAIDLVNSEQVMTVWNGIVADAMKEAVAADMSVHSAGFTGVDLKAGLISREKMFHTYPRFFSLDNKWGWYVYKVRVSGVFIKLVLDGILRTGRGLTFSGLTFDIKTNWRGKRSAKNILVNGRKLQYFETYTVALPEGIVKGGFGITPLVKYLLSFTGRIETTMWEALENKIRQIDVIDQDYGNTILSETSSANLADRSEKERGQKKGRRLFVPALEGVKIRK